jgi:tetratricopeptide (TPR) repeat protein
MRPSFRSLALPLLAVLAVPTCATLVQAQTDDLHGGIRLYEKREYPAARAALERAAEIAPREPQAPFYLSRIAFYERRYDDAVDLLEQAIDRDDRNASYHVALAEVLGTHIRDVNFLKQVRFARRIKRELERALELDPASLDAREGLALFYSRAPRMMGGSEEKTQEQVAAIRHADAFRGAIVAARADVARKDAASAERELVSAIALHPDSVEGYLRLATFYNGFGRRPQDALATMQRFLERSPDHPRALLQLGLAQQSLLRWDDAFATFERAIRLDPANMPALYQIGRTASLSGQRLDRGEQALEAYLLYVPMPREPTLASAHYQLGTLHEKKSDVARARAEYVTATKLEPRLADAKAALMRLGTGR